jgi:hypothetical protein
MTDMNLEAKEESGSMAAPEACFRFEQNALAHDHVSMWREKAQRLVSCPNILAS